MLKKSNCSDENFQNNLGILHVGKGRHRHFCYDYRVKRFLNYTIFLHESAHKVGNGNSKLTLSDTLYLSKWSTHSIIGYPRKV